MTKQSRLDELSLKFDERDISKFKYFLEFLKAENLLEVSSREYERLLFELEEIGQLKLNGKIFGFSVRDAYKGIRGEKGIGLYLRQNNSLTPFQKSVNEPFYTVNNAIKKLIEHDISTIYTVPLKQGYEFFGIPYVTDSFFTTELKEVKAFEEKDIKVITLDSLI